MEKELFDWDGWDGDQEIMTFYKVVLKVYIGEHEPGDHFDNATILFNKGILQLNRDKQFWEYKLQYSVGAKL